MNKRFTAIGLGLALAAAAVTAATPAAPAGAAAATIADVVLSDSAKDDAKGFDRNWHDYDIVTQAVLLFPDLVAAISDPNAKLTVPGSRRASSRTSRVAVSYRCSMEAQPTSGAPLSSSGFGTAP